MPYAPDSVSLGIEGSGWAGPWQESIVLRGDFVQGSYEKGRSLFFIPNVTSYGGGDICPAVEKMMWMVLERGSGRGIVYFTTLSIWDDDEVTELERFLDGYGLKLIAPSRKRRDGPFVVPVLSRKDMEGVLRIWNLEAPVLPSHEFLIFAPKPSSFETLLAEAFNLVNGDDGILEERKSASDYVLGDYGEGPRNELWIHSANRRSLEWARARVEEIWKSHGVRVENAA